MRARTVALGRGMGIAMRHTLATSATGLVAASLVAARLAMAMTMGTARLFLPAALLFGQFGQIMRDQRNLHADDPLDTILELGSGTGAHGLILQNIGYDIYGLEQSLQMTDKANLRGFPCEQADIREFTIDRKFDAVISLFHVISYIIDNESLNQVFKNASNCLNPGGLFIFDVWYSPAVYHQKPEIRIKKVEDEEICVIRLAEPEMLINQNG